MVSRDFVFFYKNNGLAYNRLGVCASKKVIGNAVARNRAKRLIREVYRLNRPYYSLGFDMVFVARAGLLKLTSSQLNQEVRSRLAQAGLINLT